MPYTDVDQLAINTIRVLAVSLSWSKLPLTQEPRPRQKVLPRQAHVAVIRVGFEDENGDNASYTRQNLEMRANNED
jgi:hypothetical protein